MTTRRRLTNAHAEMEANQPGYYVHPHHDWPLISWMDKPQERRDAIDQYKPIQEKALRLELFTGPIPDHYLPPALRTAKAIADVALKRYVAALVKAEGTKNHVAWDRVEIENENTNIAFDRFSAADTAVDWETLHKRLMADGLHPPWCPWDGKTIFAKGYNLELLL